MPHYIGARGVQKPAVANTSEIVAKGILDGIINMKMCERLCGKSLKLRERPDINSTFHRYSWRGAIEHGLEYSIQ